MNHQERSERIDRLAQRLHLMQDKVEHAGDIETAQSWFDQFLNTLESATFNAECGTFIAGDLTN